MSCKFLVESKSYKVCALCSNKDTCNDSTIKSVLLSASDAYKKTMNIIKTCSTKELIEINGQILGAIDSGKFSICGEGRLQTETSQKLKQLGYNIQVGSQYNTPLWKISW